MDSHYQPIYQHAAAMQHKFHDYTAGAAHDPTAQLLRNEIHHLTNDLATGRNPRTIEDRVRTIQTQLQQQAHSNPSAAQPGHTSILNYNQSNALHKDFESMRQNIRQHPHY